MDPFGEANKTHRRIPCGGDRPIVDPELDEVLGMLDLLIPLMAGGIVSGGLALTFFPPKRKVNPHADSTTDVSGASGGRSVAR